MANRFLNNIRINDEYTLPAADGTADQIIVTDGAGNLSFIDTTTISVGESEQVHIACKNTSGVPISKGDPVYITGTVGTSFRVQIAAADASNSAKMPAVGLAESDLANNAEGYVIVSGVLKNLTTDPLSTGDGTPSSNDTVYVKAGGGLTRTKPTGSSNLIQNVGKVGRVNSANAGSIAVSTIMRTNDVPNLSTGKIWVGSSTYTTESTVVHLDEANGRMGIGTTSPSQKLTVEGNIELGTGGYIYGDTATPQLRLNHTYGSFLQYGSSSYVGVGSNVVTFRTSSSERMRITSGGNVGIGTTNPVYGTLEVYKNGSNSTIAIHEDAGTHEARLHFRTGGNDTYFRNTASKFFIDVENATNALTLDNDGDIGIGTASPTIGKLHVLQSSDSVTSGVAIEGISGGNSMRLWLDGSTRKINAGASNTMMQFDTTKVAFPNGNVGIGTTSPNGELHIKGANPEIILEDTTNPNKNKIQNTDGNMKYHADYESTQGNSRHTFFIDGSEKVRFDTNGNVGIGTTSPNSKLDSIAPDGNTNSLRLGRSDNGNYWDFNHAGNDLRIFNTAGSGSDVLIGPNSGGTDQGNRVGIGTASPTQRLHVSGNARVTGAYYDSSNSAGTSGQVLSSTATGTDWVSLSEISGVDGTGTANYVTKWSDTDTITDSLIYDDGTNIVINGADNNSGKADFAVKATGTTTNVAVSLRSGQFQVGYTDINYEGRLDTTSTAFTMRSWARDLDLRTDSSTTSHNIRFYPANAGSEFEAMRITSGGNVGIGTTSPASRLHTTVDLSVSTTDYATGSAGSRLLLKPFASTGNTYSLIQAQDAGGVSNNALALQPYGDNVGIGTTSPVYPLQITSNSSGQALSLTNNSSNISKIRFGMNTSPATAYTQIHGDGRSTGYLQFSTNDTTRLHINSSGNVGIGTTSPSRKLHVNGTSQFDSDVYQYGVNYGLYHGTIEDDYYFDDYNGSKYLSLFYKNAYSDILRYQPIDNLEYWDGSAWQDMSSQAGNVKKLLDGRKDTNWYVPSTYYKFRFTTSLATSWPTRSMVWLESSWTGSTYPGGTVTIEEDVSGTWTTRITADFDSSNGVTNWGLAARADSALHTGVGSGTNSTRITVDFYGWSPSNPSYTTLPLQNIMITSQFSGSGNTDYSALLNYDKTLTTPGKLYITTTDTNTSSTTALVLNGNEVEKRTLGSNAFNSTAYVDGTGTANTLAMWSDADTITDAPITVSGNNATFVGDIIATHAGTPTVKLIDTTNNLQARFRAANSYAYLSVDNPNNVGNSRLVFQVDGDEALHLDGSQNATFAGDVNINGGDLTITKQSDAPTMTLLHDGTNPSTSDLLFKMQFQSDYNDSHQNWGKIQLTTNASSVRTNLDFYVKSTGGNEELGLRIEGGSTTPKTYIYGDLIVEGDTTTLNTQTVEVEDNILQLNTTQGLPDTATATTSGISIYRGSGVTQASFIFDDADDTWDLTNNLAVDGNLTLNGRFYLAGTVDTNTSSTTALVLNGTEVEKRTLGSAAFSNTGDFAAASHTHDDRYYTETEADNRFVNVTGDTMTGSLNMGGNSISDAVIGFVNMGPTQGASPDYNYKYYRITNDLTFDKNRIYELLIDADDNAGYSAIYHIYISQHNNSGNNDRVRFHYISGDKDRAELLVATDEHVWVRATAKWGNIKIRAIHENEDVSSMPFATTETRPTTQADGTSDFVWNGDNNTFTDQEQWHAGNDGAGSGLDADLLDGNHASAFALSSHNHDSDYVNVTGDTMTGDLYLDDGDGATPSLYFKNGADNYWRYLMESGGDFSIKEGTSTRLTFQAGGNVGIGETNPVNPLSVYSATVNKIATFTSGDNGGLIEISDNDTTSYVGSEGSLTYIGQTAAASTNNLIIDSSGNVGIGETNPARSLEVNHSSQQGVARFVSGSTTMAFIDLKDANTTADNKVRFGAVGDELSLWANGERMRIDSNGNVGIGETNPGAKLVVAGGSDNLVAVFSSTDDVAQIEIVDNDTSTFLGSKNGLSYISPTAGTPADGLVVSSSGDVGIGEINPASKLQVAGGVQMADDTATASANKVGTLRYRTSGNNSYVDMCMQTGASTYEWINIVQNNW